MIPFNPCSLPKVITAVPAVTEENVVETPTIDCPIPTSLTNLSTDSLVILFLRSLVTTSPSGALFANVDAEKRHEIFYYHIENSKEARSLNLTKN